jgi:hypothetical protein
MASVSDISIRLAQLSDRDQLARLRGPVAYQYMFTFATPADQTDEFPCANIWPAR